MKTAIIYSSKHGTTAKVAVILAEKLKGKDISLFNLDEQPKPSVTAYDLIVIGGSIHIGHIQKNVKRFCSENLDFLLQKHTALFICCLQKDKEQEQFERAFPPVLRKHSFAHAFLGGELLFERMNWLDSFIARKVSGKKVSYSALNFTAIGKFADALQNKAETLMLS